MARRKVITQVDIDFIDSVWAYNKTLKRFQFDCKTYENKGKWYWLHNDMYVRDVNLSEYEFMLNYLKINF